MKAPLKRPQRQGFALIVTLSLMILLTVIAVGLLTLSSVSLRATNQGNAMAAARSNARLAMMLALGELQKYAGPDQRITAPGAIMAESSAQAKSFNLPQVTGVWNSWKIDQNNIPGAGDYDKTGSRKSQLSASPATGGQGGFLKWLVSHPDPAALENIGTARDGLSLAADKMVELVAKNTVTTAKAISAGKVNISNQSQKVMGSYAYAVMDEGARSRIDLAPEVAPTGQGERLTQVGSAAKNNFSYLNNLGFLDGNNAEFKKSFMKLASLDQTDLLAGKIHSLAEYSDDFTISSLSVQSNVTDGGLKKDLSILFDPSPRKSVSLAPFVSGRVYSGTNSGLQSSGSDPLWSVYSKYAKLYSRSSAGLTAVLPSSYTLTAATSGTPAYYKTPNLSEPPLVPSIVRVDVVFSLVTREIHIGGAYGSNLTAPWPDLYNNNFRFVHLNFLPIITLHNPYNVPITLNNYKVGFQFVPVRFKFFVGLPGQPANTPVCNYGGDDADGYYLGESRDGSYATAGNGTERDKFSVTLSNSATSAAPVTIGAGETKIFGKPYDGNISFDSDGRKPFADQQMSNWANQSAKGKYLRPGMVTTGQLGFGYDEETNVTNNYDPAYFTVLKNCTTVPTAKTALDSTQVKNRASLLVHDDTSIRVEIMPAARTGANTLGSSADVNAKNIADNTFIVSTTLNGKDLGKTQFYYKNQSQLKSVLQSGTSLRFGRPSYPISFPLAPKAARDFYEKNTSPVKDYALSKPITILSFGAKTTMESFSKSRPFADTGINMLHATSDVGTTVSTGTAPMELELTPTVTTAGTGATVESTGANNDMGFFFGGYGVQYGTPKSVDYEIPDAPLQSIAQLRHAIFNRVEPPYVTYAAGESRAHPSLPLDKVVVAATTGSQAKPPILDHSWLSNTALWDGYWFSTVSTLSGLSYGGASAKSESALATDFLSNSGLLPNPRNTPYLPAGRAVTTAVDEILDVDKPSQSSAYILTKGGFNINSTSVPAWTSVLSSLKGANIPIAGGGTLSTGDSAFPRVRMPVESGSDANSHFWTEFRKLDQTQIDALAKAIVEEIHARGPFLSLGEFVNRRPVAGSDFNLKGTIQAAIDNTPAINSSMTNCLPISSSDVSGYGWKSPAAVDEKTTTAAGSPGEVSQGDVLSVIGSYITARSDTFRIRTYGDTKDNSGNIIARAWCECVVQRVPDYVDPADAPALSPPTSVINQIFGRKFHIVSFRWLGKQEV